MIRNRRRRDTECKPRREPTTEIPIIPSKSRGQNFLTQAAIADRIVALAELKPDDCVVEIGPGLGILTERITAQPVGRVTLIELDREICTRLRRQFASNPHVNLIEADFLRVDFDELAHDGPLKIIGNLPFNVASAIFRVLCEHSNQIALAVLMFQREVAERIRAEPGSSDYGALSVFAKIYFEIDRHFRVSAGSFHPRPKVDAEVLRLRPLATRQFDDREEDLVLRCVRAAFHASRKMLRNSLAGGLGIDNAFAERILVDAGIDPTARAESLCVADFVRLARSLAGSGLAGNGLRRG